MTKLALPLLVAAVVSLAPRSVMAQSQPTDRFSFASTGDELEVWVQPLGGPAAECMTPCTLRLPEGEVWLETEAHGVRANRGALLLPRGGGSVTLQAADGQAYAWGILNMIFGAASLSGAAVGSMMYLLSAPNDPYNQSMAGMFGGMGGVMGTLSLSLGLALFFSNQTGIELEPLAPPSGGGAYGLGDPR